MRAGRAFGSVHGPWILAVRIAVAAVWIAFGLFFKVLGLVPRHRQIVAAVVGEELATPVTLLVGLAETCLGLWYLSGHRPRLCMGVQTAAIVAMNSLELFMAWHWLLAPLPMLAANALFLGAGWWAALRTSPRRHATPVA